MTGVVMLVTALAVVCMVAIVVSSGAVVAWRRERLRARLLAERLILDGRLEALTAQTLQAMRQASREYLSQRARP